MMSPATVPQASPAAAPAAALPNTAATTFNRPSAPPPIGAAPAAPVSNEVPSVGGLQQPDLITSPIEGQARAGNPIKTAFILSIFYKHGFDVNAVVEKVPTVAETAYEQVPNGALPGAAAGAAAGVGAYAHNLSKQVIAPKVTGRTNSDILRMISEVKVNRARATTSPLKNLAAVVKNQGLLSSAGGAARAAAPLALGGALAGTGLAALVSRARERSSNKPR